jgi:hypothetical protein
MGLELEKMNLRKKINDYKYQNANAMVIFFTLFFIIWIKSIINRITFIIISPAYSMLLLMIVGCTNNSTENKAMQDSVSRELPKIDNNKIQTNSKDITIRSNPPDFLEISKKAKESFIGYLQGVEKSDSSGPFVIREYISDTLSFALIFSPKQVEKSAVDFKAIRKAAANNYDDYLCLAFVYPMKNVDPANKDYHVDTTPYPISIESYLFAIIIKTRIKYGSKPF